MLADLRISRDLGDKGIVDLPRIERAQSQAAEAGDSFDLLEEAR